MPLNRLIDSGIPFQPDVQTTTLGLDVLSRYVTSTWDEAVHNGGAPFDAVVIGAGMFGGYCAEQIYRQGAHRGLRILVLDAGPFVVASHLQNLPRIGLFEPQPLHPAADSGAARALVWGMPWRSNVEWVGQAYCVGGKSLYWGGWCPRLLPDDLVGWPPSVATYLNLHYGTLERQTGVDVRTDFIQGPLFELLMARTQTLVEDHALPNIDAVEEPPLAVQGDPPAAGLFSFDKFSSVTLLVDAVREAAQQADAQRRIFVVPNAHVTRLQTSNGGVNAVQAVVNGIPRSLPVSASTSVILALGTIESTRLALVSFPRSANPTEELMGRNLMGHVRIDVYARIRRSALDLNNVLPEVVQTGALLVRGSTPDGRFHIQVTASADPSLNSDAMLFTMIPDIDQLDQLLRSQKSGWIALALRGSSQMDGDRVSAVPNAAGRWINLSPFEADEFGVPRAYVQMTSSPNENTLANAMEQAMITLLQRLAGDPSDLEIVSTSRNGLGTTYHEAGTLWMGTDSNTSVTDPNGRFHHIQNAYCADQSLFFSVGSVNPTLTGLTLARKVAQAVVARANGQPAPA